MPKLIELTMLILLSRTMPGIFVTPRRVQNAGEETVVYYWEKWRCFILDIYIHAYLD